MVGVRHPQVHAATVRHQPIEVETMTATAPEQKPKINNQPLTHDPEGDLGASGADSDRQRWTRNESERPHDRGLAVALWLLASLIAEVELLSWFFAHMYRQ
jgi:hypothetical protein